MVAVVEGGRGLGVGGAGRATQVLHKLNYAIKQQELIRAEAALEGMKET